MRHAGLVVASAIVAVAALQAPAEAKQVKFKGPHPVHGKGGGWCYIEAPHVHIYGPPAKAEVTYRQNDGAYVFVGDPVPHGYDGPRHAYNGHHPVPVNVILDEPEPETEYCYINGPHYHYYAIEPGADFEVRGGVTYYVGHFPEAYVEARPRYVREAVYYEEYDYARPVVLVEPPHVHGEVGFGVGVVGIVPVAEVHTVAPVVEGGVVGEVHGGVGFHAGVEVAVPVPTIEVTVPGVIVEEHHHGVIYVDKHHGHGHGRGWKKGHWK